MKKYHDYEWKKDTMRIINDSDPVETNIKVYGQINIKRMNNFK